MAKLLTSVLMQVVSSTDTAEIIGQLKKVDTTGIVVTPGDAGIITLADGVTRDFYPSYLSATDVEFIFNIEYNAITDPADRKVNMNYDAVGATLGGHIIAGKANTSCTMNNNTGAPITVRFMTFVLSNV